jgi:hypothetical protein
LYAIKKLFISNKKFGLCLSGIWSFTELQVSGNTDLHKMIGSNRDGIGNGKCGMIKNFSF